MSSRRSRGGPKLSYAERGAAEHRRKLELLRAFVKRHGWSKFRTHTVVHGVSLGRWAQSRRRRHLLGKLEPWLVAECESVPGWSWSPIRVRQQRKIDLVSAFVRRRGWKAMTRTTRVGGLPITTWVQAQRARRKRGVLAHWMIGALETIPGWSWDPLTEIYRQNLAALRSFVRRRGWRKLGLTTVVLGVRVGAWASKMRSLHRRRGRLPKWVVAALESIPGWTWVPVVDRQTRMANLLRKFVQTHGWDAIRVTTLVDGVGVGLWLHSARSRRKTGDLSATTTTALEAIPGFRWDHRRAAPRSAR